MAKISEIVSQLQDHVAILAVESEKAENGNRSAGVRARKILMEIKTLAGEGRKAITDIKNT